MAEKVRKFTQIASP